MIDKELSVKGLTWKDVNTLDTLIDQVRHEFPNGISEKSFGLAVLEKFQDYHDDAEELASEDLEEEMIRWHKEHFGNKRDWEKTSGEYLTRKSQLDLARHFAEWQRQKDQEEHVSEDLEEASWNYSNRDGIGYGQRYAMQIDFKAGAEWQKQQMKEALQTEYEKGRFDMREEMMKDAVIAWVNTYESVTNPYDNEVSFITNLSPSKFKNKGMVKIIIVNEDEK